MDTSTAHARTSRSKRSLRLIASCASVVVFATSLGAAAAHGDTLADLRARAAAAAAAQKNAQNSVAESRSNVANAAAQLENAQSQLAAARAVLADTRVQLAAARERDAQLAAELKAAQVALEEARQRVAQGERDVAVQQQVIITAVTESYQQRTNLAGLSVVFESGSTAEVGQRIQWNTTIFDTQAAEKARLDAILKQLEEARDEAAALEAQVAEAKREAAATVARIRSLEAAAAEQERAVSALVAANASAKEAAEAELAADEAQYASYAAQEQQLQREIQGELARLKAEAEARERAAREAAAREAAARQKSQTASASSGTNTSSSRSGGRAVSSYGLIRPIDASPGSPFGMRFHPILKIWRMHNGNDWGARTGTPIYAAASGVVLKAGPNGGFGNFVLIGHDSSINGKYVTTGYAHQSRIAVSVGQRVQRGQVIGYVGNTGLSTTPHLHFEVRLNGVPVNPMLYLP